MTRGLRVGTTALLAAGVLSLGAAPSLASSHVVTHNPETSAAGIDVRVPDLIFGVATPADQKTFVLTESNGDEVQVRLNSDTEFESGTSSAELGEGVLVAVLGHWTRSGDFEAQLVFFPDNPGNQGSTPGGSGHEAPAPGGTLPGAPPGGATG